MMHKINVRIIKQTSLSENLTKVAQRTELKLASVLTVREKNVFCLIIQSTSG